MRILGISALYHDSAAALIFDGQIIAAAQEERFTRRKHDAGFPEHAIRYCLAEARCGLDDLDLIVFYDKPFLKFERLLETYLTYAPRGFASFSKAMPVWLREKLFLKDLLLREFRRLGAKRDLSSVLLFSEHHLSHAASAFYPSPFKRAAVLTLDGVGEWATSSLALGNGNDLAITKEIHFPHSLGLLYSAFTYYAGFKVNSGEYKVMGLAPYGEPRFAQRILDNLVDVKPDGSFRLNMRYFNYCAGLTMTSERFHRLFEGKPRQPEAPLTQRDMDLAASVQSVTEEIMLRMTRSIRHETGEENLCLAGGVALNCVANGKILRDATLKQIWIQPSSGDAGAALGAAYVGCYLFAKEGRVQENGRDAMKGSYLGPIFPQEDIETRLEKMGAKFEICSEEGLLDNVAHLLAKGNAVGWFQGRMEYGPRALGGRSILADPRSPEMQSVLNLKIKYRESFRPFAPSVLREDLNEWFDLDVDSPYMLLVASVRSSHQRAMPSEAENCFGIDKLHHVRSDIPAVTHVDYSARVQTVHADTNPLYHRLISRFKALTGCPVVVNTSFNVRGEPIVCTPEDAFRCFMGTEMDVLAIGNCLLLKEDQSPALKEDYKARFELD